MCEEKTIGILTSGGDSPGMNAAIRAAVRAGIYEGMNVYGIYRGYEGLLDGDIKKLDESSVADILHRGGTMLRTARSKKFTTIEGQEKAQKILESYRIKNLVLIGGDGSFNGGLKLAARGIRVMALPGTIDNDLAYTDYTIGFDTAVNTVLSALGNIRDTSSSHERTTIVEVMGRNCGDIAVWAGICGGAESILIPEVPIDINKICVKLLQGRKRGKLHSIIIKAEGVSIGTEELASMIRERTGIEARTVVLGYIQRGGSPTAKDRMLASSMAYKAVKLIKDDDDKSYAVGIRNGKIINVELENALKATRSIDKNFISLSEALSI